MTYQQKVEFLKSYQKADAAVDQTAAQLALCRQHRQRLAAGGTAQKDLAWMEEEYCGYEKQLRKQVEGLVQVRIRVLRAIQTVRDPVLQQVLHLRYIKGLTFEMLADQMQYSWRHIYRLHKKAVDTMWA